MSPLCRPARLDDLSSALAVVVEAFNDVNRRHGSEDFLPPLGTGFAAFFLKDDPSGLWVAEEKGEIIGFGFSWTADRMWFLADLFVKPQWQSSGIGQVLMRHTLDQAETAGSQIKALITFAFNRASIGLYMRQGLFPRVPLYKLAGPRATFSPRPIKTSLRMGTIGPGDLAALETIDRSSLGLSRDKHHHFLAGDETTGFLFSDAKGQPVAYAYVAKDGHAGPIAVTSIDHMPEVMCRALAVAADQKADNISVFLPGLADAELTRALDAGLRIQRTMVLMSSHSFGDWTRYAPSDPGMM